MKNMKKILVLALAALLLVAVSVAGTVAYLTATTAPVTNTFTAAGIDITLDETKGLTDGSWTMPAVPGTSQDKDPIVAVEKTTTVDIWLFVKFDETVDENTVTYTSNLTDTNSWTKISGITENVWYRAVTAAEIAQGTTCTDCREDGDLHFHLLDGDSVSINKDATVNAQMNQIAGGAMTWTAYAIQQTGLKDSDENELDADDIVTIYTMAGGTATFTN